MKKLLFSFALSVAAAGLMNTASAQTCDGQRYYSKIFSQVDTTTRVYTDPSVTSQLIDIYQPTGDVATMRKAILFIHGGSFYGGSKNDAFLSSMCREFAKRGYVTASINYRLVPLTSIISLQDSNTAYPYVIKAISDAKAAVRYLKKNAAALNIDSNWIVIGGESAGAIIGNHIAYVKSINEATPLLTSSFAAVGGIDGNSGNPGYTTKARAVLNYAGSLLFTGLLDATDTEPIYSAHGDVDNTVPYLCGKVLGGASNITTCGSGAMKPVLDGLGTLNKLHTFVGDQHVPWEGDQAKADIVERESALFLYQLDCPAFASIDDVAADVALGLFPNPASNQVSIKADVIMNSVSVIDALGRTVTSNTINATEGKVDVSNLAHGIYVAKIELKDNRTATKTFVVE